jgi:hypothetical protein
VFSSLEMLTIGACDAEIKSRRPVHKIEREKLKLMKRELEGLHEQIQEEQKIGKGSIIALAQEPALLRSRAACSRIFFDAVFDGGKFTPARRALDSPMAIACLVERPPCLPSLTCSISSRTNSPAWVLADLPSRSYLFQPFPEFSFAAFFLLV